GRNTGWETAVDMGRKPDRPLGGIAPARRLGLLRYEAGAHGLVVVTVEESDTSQTPCFDNDPLSRSTEEDLHQAADAAPAAASMSGKRSTENRNWFVRRKDAVKENEISKYHADVNGAFNIIRKVFDDFCYHAGLSLKFTVRWISPRRGAVTPLSCL